jgi:hypothetical protein
MLGAESIAILRRFTSIVGVREGALALERGGSWREIAARSSEHDPCNGIVDSTSTSAPRSTRKLERLEEHTASIHSNES